MGIDVELDSLLDPIPGEKPGGVDLREDDDPNNIYRRIKDARNEARQEETQADEAGTGYADAHRVWRDVWDQGVEYIQNQAKDLEVAAYMIEASIRLGGFQGLSTALEMTTELVSRFWGELLPTPDEDGIETTVLPISRLNGDVITYPLMRVPVTEDTSVGEMLVWQHQQAQQLEGLDAEEQQIRVSRGAITLSTFNQAVAETSREFFIDLKAGIDRARACVDKLSEVFEEKATYEFSPNLSRFASSFDQAEAVLSQIAGDVLAAAEAEVAADEAAEAESTGDAPAGGGAVAAAPPPQKKELISSRQDAFDLLEKVAQWFETNEPQSLLPPEIRKVIKRGRMSPQELFQDLISDENARYQLYKDVGIDVNN